MERRRVIGGMIPDPPWPAREACSRWSHTNLGDIESYPLLKHELDDLLERFSRIVFSRIYPGFLTSGATESNLLALMYWRKKGKRRVIATKASHYSVSKAAYILGMGYREYSIDEIVDNAGPNDVVVVTMGKTETGFVDDVDLIYDRVREKGAAIHIDAAYFGSIARFVLGKDLYLDEFMATFAVDLHKIPESPPPAGVLFAFSDKVIEDLWFESPYLPGKRQFGILGTRPGCSVFAASVSLRIVMEDWPGGPSGLAYDLNSVVDDIVGDLSRVGFESIGGPAPIRCIKHKYIYKIRKYLENNGYRVYSCLGDGIRIVAMPHHIWQGYKWIKDALVTAAEEG